MNYKGQMTEGIMRRSPGTNIDMVFNSVLKKQMTKKLTYAWKGVLTFKHLKLIWHLDFDI